jgi:hypothetical protein
VYLQPDLVSEADVIPWPDEAKVESFGKHVLSKTPGLRAGNALACQACLVLGGEERDGPISTAMARGVMAIAHEAVYCDLCSGHDGLGNTAGTKTHSHENPFGGISHCA